MIEGALVDLIEGAFVDLIEGALVDLMEGALVDLIEGAFVDLEVAGGAIGAGVSGISPPILSKPKTSNGPTRWTLPELIMVLCATFPGNATKFPFLIGKQVSP